jgi:transcriptional regulator with XRE-family HTH domain
VAAVIKALEPVTIVDPGRTEWPETWNTEDERAMRYPRSAAHWYASRRRRRELAKALCAEVDAVVARQIRAERVRAGLRQVDLAEAIGVAQATMSRLESGKSPATVADIVRIAVQLERPLEAFIKPPGRGPKTGWERRGTIPRIPYELYEAAMRDELPEEHPIYD